MASIPFTKMQGAGNDFIVVNNMALRLDPALFPTLARRVCARRLSLGGDALMVADFPAQGGDVRMRFYNSDGSEGEMCGNGARCLARYACDKGLAREAISIETAAGPVQGWRLDRRTYKIRLNSPRVLELEHPLAVDGTHYPCSYVELGCPGLPHAVVHLPGLAKKSFDELRPLGAAIRSHPSFPRGANVNFWDFGESDTLTLRTFERGVEDFTLACGTGSGSTAVALTLLGLVRCNPVSLRSPGGLLQIEVERHGDSAMELFLIGETNVVAEGIITDEELELPFSS